MSVLLQTDLLSGFQLECNWALVNKNSLNALPMVDEILTFRSGERRRTVEIGEAQWSLSGPMHRLSIRSRHGFDSLQHAEKVMSEEYGLASDLAKEVDGRLMGVGMHPWMLASNIDGWPHGPTVREDALQSIFGNARHGFANQQCLGLSLPFQNDSDFEGLWAALRFVLPLLPAMAASSPFVEGHLGPARNCRLAARRDYFDTELDFEASLVPKHYSCRAALQAELGTPLEEALRKRKWFGVLQAGDVCGDGMLADFQAGLVHITVLDMQECLQANLGVCGLVVAMTRNLIWQVDVPLDRQRQWPSARLNEILEPMLCHASEGVIRDVEYLRAFAYPERGPCRAGELLQFLIEEKLGEDPAVIASAPALKQFVDKGSLATRLLTALPENWDAEALYEQYGELLKCQLENRLF